MKVVTKEYLLNQFRNFSTNVVEKKVESVSTALSALDESLKTVAKSGKYTDLTDTPTALSEFTNDRKYQTDTEVSTAIEAAVNTAVSSAYIFKESVENYAALQAIDTDNMKIGSVYNVIDTNMNYAWDGEDWDPLGSTFDPSSINDDISGVKSRVTQNETDISNLQSSVSNITEEDSDIDFSDWDTPPSGQDPSSGEE